MSGWAEEAMQEAIDLLARSGRNDLASDLNRVLTTVDFDGLEIMRSADSDSIADEIVEAATLSELLGTFRRLTGALSVDHCTFHVVCEAASTSFTTKVLTTYPEEWVSRYVERRYHFIDPVIHACRSQTQPFFWDDLDCSDTVLRTFWNDARSFGVGPSGYSLPIITERGDRLAVSISSSVEGEAFRQNITQCGGDLFNLGILLADAFCTLASENRPATFSPTDDQLTVLRAVAAGASEADLKGQSFQFGSYTTVERSICALFRTKTLAQAAVLAAKSGLLDNVPLLKADVLSASDKSGTGRVVLAPNVQSLRKLARLRNAAPDREHVLQAVGGGASVAHLR